MEIMVVPVTTVLVVPEVQVVVLVLLEILELPPHRQLPVAVEAEEKVVDLLQIHRLYRIRVYLQDIHLWVFNHQQVHREVQLVVAQVVVLDQEALVIQDPVLGQDNMVHLEVQVVLEILVALEILGVLEVQVILEHLEVPVVTEQ
jgi:hypothetical protein